MKVQVSPSAEAVQNCARAGAMERFRSNLTRPSKICWETDRL
jgi:hypothetical protein